MNGKAGDESLKKGKNNEKQKDLCRRLEETLNIGESFDLLRHQITVAGVKGTLFYIDGFVKDVILTKLEDVRDADCVIVAVAHNEFKRLTLNEIKSLFKGCDDSQKVLVDVKGLYKVDELEMCGMNWWRL